MRLAAAIAAGLPGWKVVSSDPRTRTINAEYRTRVLGLLDDVRIVVTPRSEVDVCSRTRAGDSGAQWLFSTFQGDFGSNIGRVKEFYLALAPAADQEYRQVEIKQTAEQSGFKALRP